MSQLKQTHLLVGLASSYLLNLVAWSVIDIYFGANGSLAATIPFRFAIVFAYLIWALVIAMEYTSLVHQIKWLLLASAPLTLGEVSAPIVMIFWRGKLSVLASTILGLLYIANAFCWCMLLYTNVKRRPPVVGDKSQ